MSLKMPQKLLKSPLRETIFEIRFEPSTPAAGDLFPGLLYASLKSDYPEVASLPMANVPRAVREKNPDLLYQPSHSLRSNAISVQIGDRGISLHAMEYPGWTRYKEKLESLIEAVRATGLAKRVERFSFKYVNLIESASSEKQLSLINMKVEVNGAFPIERGFHLRLEHDDEKCVTIVQLIPNSTGKILGSGKEVSGLLIDVDTIRLDPGQEFWTNPGVLLEEGHSVAKLRFFSLLTKSALDKLEPVW